MKKTLPPAKLPLPKFQSDQEAAAYFESHSVAGIWDQMPEGRKAKPSPELARKIRERHARLKSPISLRLNPELIAAAKRVAAAKSIGYQTQQRMWIAEGIRREAKKGVILVGSTGRLADSSGLAVESRLDRGVVLAFSCPEGVKVGL